MTKNSLDLWSESFLKVHEIFLFKKTLKVVCIIESIIFKNRFYLAIIQKLWLIIKKAAYSKLTGHPNQSGHITSFTAKCKEDVNSEDPDSKPAIQKTHLYHHYWSLNNTCFSGCKVSFQDMTKKFFRPVVWQFPKQTWNFPFSKLL